MGGAARAKYGFVTLASLALTMLTGSKLTFFVDGRYICSGFVARAMERTGTLFDRDPVHITPADLAKYYGACPPAAAVRGGATRCRRTSSRTWRSGWPDPVAGGTRESRRAASLAGL